MASMQGTMSLLRHTDGLFAGVGLSTREGPRLTLGIRIEDLVILKRESAGLPELLPLASKGLAFRG